jgi:DNA polymerase delta subunit 1
MGEYFILHFNAIGEQTELYTINRKNERVTLIVEGFTLKMYVDAEKVSNINAFAKACPLKITVDSSDMPLRFQKRIVSEFDELHDFYEFQAKSSFQVKKFIEYCRARFVNPYDANITSNMAFFADKGLSGGGWFRTSINYEQPEPFKFDGVTYPSIIGRVPYEDINFFDCEDIPPLWMLTFDLELLGTLMPDGTVKYSTEGLDPIIMISSILTYYDGSNITRTKYLHCYREINPIEGVTVVQCDDERDLFRVWQHFMLKLDPDILSGWNVIKYDIYTLEYRARVLNLPNFPHLGKPHYRVERFEKSQNKWGNNDVIEPCPITVFTPKHAIGSVQTGQSKTSIVNFGGRFIIDGCVTVKVDHNTEYPSKKLGRVAKKKFKVGKEDVSYNEIPIYYNGTIEQRTKLAKYCCIDSELAERWIVETSKIEEAIIRARAANMQISDVYNKGMSAKSMAILLVIARPENYVVPYKENEMDDGLLKSDKKKKGKYTGATVLEPVPGLYRIPVNVLDFQSLYPSEEMANNLCPSTYIPEEKLHLVPEDCRTKSPPEYTLTGTHLNDGHWFCNKNVKVGLIPRAQERLAKRRAIYKAKKAAATNKDDVKRFDIAQNAMKLMMNSIYGFTGFACAVIYCQAVASATTAYARKHHQMMCDYITKWAADHGYKVLIIYGDTDSVFFTLYIKDLEENIRISKILADGVTEHIGTAPVKLLYEKSFVTLLMMIKKQYAGKKWQDGNFSFAVSGIKSKKSDASIMLKETTDHLLEMLIEKSCSVQECSVYLHNQLKTIRSVNETWDHELIEKIKVPIKYGKEDYKNKNLQTELATLYNQRNPIPASVGDYFHYVPYVQYGKGAKRDRVDHSTYLEEYGRPRKAAKIEDRALTEDELSFLKRIESEFVPTEDHSANRSALEAAKVKDIKINLKRVIDTSDYIKSQFHKPITRLFPDANDVVVIKKIFEADEAVESKKIAAMYRELEANNQSIITRNTIKAAQQDTGKKTIASYFVQKSIKK